MRASGPGGQNVNKVSSAVQLRFDVRGSESLPEEVRERLLHLARNRINRDGVLVIDARRFRAQERNREDARARLAALVRRAAQAPTPRVATRPTRALEAAPGRKQAPAGGAQADPALPGRRRVGTPLRLEEGGHSRFRAWMALRWNASAARLRAIADGKALMGQEARGVKKQSENRARSSGRRMIQWNAGVSIEKVKERDRRP